MVQKNFGMRIGSRAQVFHGTAKQTSGGLRRSDLKKNKRGAIVSKKASARAKKENRLVKAGYVTQRGKFGVVQKGGDEYDLLRKVLDCYGYKKYEDKFIKEEITFKALSGLDKEEIEKDLWVAVDDVYNMYMKFQLFKPFTDINDQESRVELWKKTCNFSDADINEMIQQLKKTKIPGNLKELFPHDKNTYIPRNFNVNKKLFSNNFS